MKTSFIATVLNEEESILEFVKSLISQTKKPDEIIIVDAGSRDKTKDLIKKFKGIKLYTKKGNRSVGRNYAIKRALGDIIIVSDAGCVLDKNYIKNIIDPFNDKRLDVVSGFYHPITNSIFEKCLATYTCVMPDKVDKKNFIPSSRSIAFRKHAWKKVNGYREDLDTCEDLIFAEDMKKQGFKFKFQKNAFVMWRQQSSFLSAWKQFYNYAVGDGQAMYFRPQTPLVFLRYILGLISVYYIFSRGKFNLLSIIFILIFIYTLWSIQKNYKYVKNWKAFIILPLLQYLSDIAVITGMSTGIIKIYKFQR